VIHKYVQSITVLFFLHGLGMWKSREQTGTGNQKSSLCNDVLLCTKARVVLSELGLMFRIYRLWIPLWSSSISAALSCHDTYLSLSSVIQCLHILRSAALDP